MECPSTDALSDATRRAAMTAASAVVNWVVLELMVPIFASNKDVSGGGNTNEHNFLGVRCSTRRG